ncbi:MAG TPA: hypothetical protein VFR78_23915 [Pyrinomonadaceae bacterium]|nr:hypothetical protein [Pyrinomonadaceae bacterium]
MKVDAYKSTTDEKYAYQSPDGKTVRNKRPDQALIDAGWKFTKVKFQRVESCMSPRHPRCRDYRNAKRRATLLLAARLILKATNGTVPDKEQIGPLLSMGTFRSHARTASVQKSLAYSSYRQLRKLDNRQRKQPDRFNAVVEWIRQREVQDA